MAYEVLPLNNDYEEKLICPDNRERYKRYVFEKDGKYTVWENGCVCERNFSTRISKDDRCKYVLNAANELDGLVEIYQLCTLPDKSHVFKKIFEENYVRDKRHGEFVSYDGIGDVVKTRNYDNGVLLSVKDSEKIVYYDKNGDENKIEYLDKAGNIIKIIDSYQLAEKRKLVEKQKEEEKQRKYAEAKKFREEEEARAAKHKAEREAERAAKEEEARQKLAQRAEYKKTIRYKLAVAACATQIPGVVLGLMQGAFADEMHADYDKLETIVGLPGQSVAYLVSSITFGPFVKGVEESAPRLPCRDCRRFGHYLKNTENTGKNIVHKLCFAQYLAGGVFGVLLNGAEKIFVARGKRVRVY